MRWVDLHDTEWHMPSANREKGTGGVLVLPPMVVAIIQSQPRFADNPFVFAGRGSKQLNSFSERKAALDAKLPEQTPKWVLHDLRRSAKSLMSRAGVRPDLSERVLGHVIGGIEGVYDRHSYLEEKADALEKLAGLIGIIVNPPEGNVIALRC